MDTVTVAGYKLAVRTGDNIDDYVNMAKEITKYTPLASVIVCNDPYLCVLLARTRTVVRYEAHSKDALTDVNLEMNQLKLQYFTQQDAGNVIVTVGDWAIPECRPIIFGKNLSHLLRLGYYVTTDKAMPLELYNISNLHDIACRFRHKGANEDAYKISVENISNAFNMLGGQPSIHLDIFSIKKSKTGIYHSEQYGPSLLLKIIEDISISAYYVGDVEAGRHTSELLILSSRSTKEQKKQSLDNYKFYSSPVAHTTILDLSRFITPKIYEVIQDNIELSDAFKDILPLNDSVTWSPPDGYNIMNPSMIATDDGYLVTVRAVNYVKQGMQFIYTVPVGNGGEGNSISYLMKFTKEWKLLRVDEIKILDDLQAKLVKFSSRWHGLEDIRLMTPTTATAVCSEYHPSGMPRVCKLTLDDQYVVDLQTYDSDNVEKNWLPFGEESYIYAHEPLQIVNPTTGNTIISTVNPELDLSGFRGSSVPVRYLGGYLYLIHIAVEAAVYRYYNRWVWMNDEGVIVSMSYLFKLFDSDVELIYSTVLHGDDIIMSVGLDDKKAMIVSVPLASVVLYPVNRLGLFSV